MRTWGGVHRGHGSTVVIASFCTLRANCRHVEAVKGALCIKKLGQACYSCSLPFLIGRLFIIAVYGCS